MTKVEVWKQEKIISETRQMTGTWMHAEREIRVGQAKWQEFVNGNNWQQEAEAEASSKSTRLTRNNDVE